MKYNKKKLTSLKKKIDTKEKQGLLLVDSHKFRNHNYLKFLFVAWRKQWGIKSLKIFFNKQVIEKKDEKLKETHVKVCY